MMATSQDGVPKDDPPKEILRSRPDETPEAYGRRHATTTGYWSYLPEVTHAAGVPAPPEDRFLSWHDFATQNGLDSDVWDL